MLGAIWEAVTNIPSILLGLWGGLVSAVTYLVTQIYNGIAWVGGLVWELGGVVADAGIELFEAIIALVATFASYMQYLVIWALNYSITEMYTIWENNPAVGPDTTASVDDWFSWANWFVPIDEFFIIIATLITIVLSMWTVAGVARTALKVGLWVIPKFPT